MQRSKRAYPVCVPFPAPSWRHTSPPFLPSCSATSAMSGHWVMSTFLLLSSRNSSELNSERRWKRSARIWAAFLVAGGAKGLQRPVLQRPETTSSPRHPATLTRCGVPRNAAGTRTRPRVAAQVRLHVACACVDDVLWACQGVQTVTSCVVKDVGRRRLTSGRGRRLQVLCAGVWALADFCIRVARLPLLPGMGARRSRLPALELVVAHCLLMCVRGRRRAYAGRHRGRAAPTCAAGCA